MDRNKIEIDMAFEMLEKSPNVFFVRWEAVIQSYKNGLRQTAAPLFRFFRKIKGVGIKLDVNNKTDDKVNVSVYIAFYDANGTLLGVKKYEETFNSGSNVTEYNNLTMEGKTKSVKVFVWNQNLKPCSAPEIIELNTTS